MDELFATYTALLTGVSAWVDEQFPRGGGRVAGRAPASRQAKALDLVRGVLPAASLSHVGHLRDRPDVRAARAPPARASARRGAAYGEMLLEELQKIMPSFVTRVPRPDRGGRWIEFLRERNEAAATAAARLGLDETGGDEVAAPSVRLIRAHGSEEELLAALLYEASTAGEEQALAAVARLSPAERAALVRDLVGRAREPAPPPRTRLRDADLPLRDRLRLRRLPRSPTPSPAHVPVAAAVARTSAPTCRTRSRRRASARSTQRALETSRAEYERLRGEGLVEEAPYALCLAYRIRYVLELDAREALHLIELRSGREGHPSYRAVALQMRDAIAAVHPSVAAAMTFVDDSTEPRLERLLSEMRNEARAGR